MLKLRTCDSCLFPLLRRLSLLATVCYILAIQPAELHASGRITPIVKAVRDCSAAVVNIEGQKSISGTAEGNRSSSRQVNGMGNGDRRRFNAAIS